MIPLTNRHLWVSVVEVVMKFSVHGVKPISLLHIPKSWTALRAEKQRLMEQQTTIDQFAFLVGLMASRRLISHAMYTVITRHHKSCYTIHLGLKWS